jgi:hemerythrin
VDEQHHHLVDVINHFGELMLRPQGSSSAASEATFGELARYAQYHFREEEALMEQAKLDPRHISHHCDDHAKFLRDVTQMHDALASGSREDASALLDYLSNWLAFHILGTDQLMASLMAARISGKSQEEAYQAYQASKDPATATLLQAMNRLFNQVSDRNRDLFELNQTLEARVAERTQELSNANQQLENMAMTDVLTGLPNRRHALLVFVAEWGKAVAAGLPLACMMIDADGFKTINDNFGHDAGDEVLRQLSRTLKGAVRGDDMVFRLGGDEFLIICSNTALEGAMQTAEKVRQAVSDLRVAAGGGVWKGSISVGVSVRTKHMKGMEELLKAADESVYVAKRNGRNCVATVCAADN